MLRKQEHELIENVFELESRTVPSSMTGRETSSGSIFMKTSRA
ncbi:hypothetical protein ACVXG7_31505 [Enterobacter hormaechei]